MLVRIQPSALFYTAMAQWQTRRLEKPAPERVCWFKSSSQYLYGPLV